MARIDYTDVEIILPDHDVSSGLITAMIDDASLWIDNYLVGACSGLSDSKLPVIEKYLAAAFVVAVDESGGQLIQSQRGDIAERFAEHESGEGPGAVFLRRAAAFEPCGIVAEFFLGRPRMRAWVGDGY